MQFVLQLLAEACNSICEHLYDFITNRYATHVARRLLCIVAGRNVLPLAKPFVGMCWWAVSD